MWYVQYLHLSSMIVMQPSKSNEFLLNLIQHYNIKNKRKSWSWEDTDSMQTEWRWEIWHRKKKNPLPPLTVKPSTAAQCWSNPIFYSCATLSVSLLTHQMNADPSCPVTSAAVTPRSESESKFHASLHSGCCCFFFLIDSNIQIRVKCESVVFDLT